MADIAKIIEEVKGMTVVELNDLVHAIEEEFGVSAAAVAVAGPAAGPAAAAVEEQTEFKVVIKSVGANKIGVIKAVKDITGAGLVEAKNLAVDGSVLKEGVSKEEADAMVAKLKEAGADAVAQ